MKGYLIIIIFSLATFCQAGAQTFSEWFSQKKTQKKYLLQQIAALQVYIGYARQGYDIARKGLTTISDIKNGDFNLHRDFFGSLKTVSLAVRRYGKIADIMAMQISIIKTYQKDIQAVKKAGLGPPRELDYLLSVYGRLLDNCQQLTQELIMICSDGKVEMKDDERLQRIDRLYLQMQDNYRFCKQFGAQAKTLMLQRQMDVKDGLKVKELYGIQTQ